jgi:predicted RNase H-like HicB family nuclease
MATETPKYHINIFFSKDDAGFIADVPDLKGCSAFGKTPELALREVQVAMKLWLKAAKSIRKPVPKPRYRPAIYAVAS